LKFHLLKFIFIFITISLNADNKVVNINTLIQTANKDNKQVITFFHMTHCGYCKRMENKTFNNTKIKSFINKHFTFIDINIDDKEKIFFDNKQYTKKDFATYLDIDFFPTVIFFDKDAEITYTARGYRSIKKFQKILEFIESKSFESMDFFDFNRDN